MSNMLDFLWIGLWNSASDRLKDDISRENSNGPGCGFLLASILASISKWKREPLCCATSLIFFSWPTHINSIWINFHFVPHFFLLMFYIWAQTNCPNFNIARPFKNPQVMFFSISECYIWEQSLHWRNNARRKTIAESSTLLLTRYVYAHLLTIAHNRASRM